MNLTLAAYEYEPFTSIDLETTGLDPINDKILEIGLCFYDGKHIEPSSELQCIVIPNGSMRTGKDFRISGQAVALAMNANLINEVVEAFKQKEKDYAKANRLSDSDIEIEGALLKTSTGILILEEDDAIEYVYQWLNHLMHTQGLKKKHIFAGKNLGSLDIPFLKEAMGNKKFDEVVSFRTLDLTSMFAPFVRQTKSLSYINKLRGLPDVSHRALIDARQTGDAIIQIYQMNLIFPQALEITRE